MEKKRNNATRALAGWGALVLAAAAVTVYFVLTSGPATGSAAPAALNTVTIGKGDPSLTFSDADKAEAGTMAADGRVTKFLRDSHEVWVDPKFWKEAPEETRRRVVLLFASLNRDFDGTRQMSVKEAGTDRTVGEYFAGNLRVEP